MKKRNFHNKNKNFLKLLKHINKKYNTKRNEKFEININIFFIFHNFKKL